MPECVVPRPGEPPALDGDWDGPGWNMATALPIDNFRPEGSSHKPKTEARLVSLIDSLYVAFRVEDRYVRCVTTDYQGPVYRDACVEFFVEPKPGRGYFNFEMNCGGALLLRHVTDPDRSSGELAAFSAVPWELGSMVQIYHSMPPVVEPEMAEPVTWIVQYRIPLDIFGPYVGPVPNPAGQLWRANFYKCAENNSHPHFASWAPVGGPLNFHQPQYFGTLRFLG